MKPKLTIIILTLTVLFIAAGATHACGTPPVADLTSNMQVGVGQDGVTVTFDASDSYDPDGKIIKYEWDFDYHAPTFDVDYDEEDYEVTPSNHEDGAFDGITKRTYTTNGTYYIMLRVTDDDSPGQADYLDTPLRVIIKSTIQEGIDEADESDERPVVVMPGIYTGTGNVNLQFHDGSQTQEITVQSIDPSDPNIVAATVIDCEHASDTRGFLFDNSETSDSVLDGLTIKKGNHTNGGGMYCTGASPTIKNSIITFNQATENGGGIYCTSSSSPDIKNCTISCNYADNTSEGGGGGIYCDGGNPKISDCTISYNIATRNGGGMYSKDATSSTDITNCLFLYNRASVLASGGGLYNGQSSPDITGCVFVGNVAGHGGGMENSEKSDSESDSPSSPIVVNCIFSDNYAVYYAGDGPYGGGMDNYYSNPTVINCTFSRNHADTGTGGGLFNEQDEEDTATKVTNCIFWGNRDDGGVDESAQIDYLTKQPNLSYTCIQYYDEHIDCTWCIDNDPDFIDADNPEGDDGIFRTYDDGLVVPFGSLCIDTGNNSDVTGITEDIIGNDRTTDGNHNSERVGTDTVDRGAYELPRIWFVDEDATAGEDDGTSWTDAYEDLQDALADPAADDEIWVAEGTYEPSTSYRSVSFALVEGVGVYGGFDATESARCERDCTTNTTTLSGDLNGNDGEDFTYRSDNSYHVVTSDTDITAAGVLDGFTVSGGYADTWPHNGGGMQNDGSPTVANCIFTDNWCYLLGAGMSNGFSSGGSSPTITNCTFSANLAVYIGGGGMYNVGALGNPTSPIVTNCTFSSNSTGAGGGGMHNYICSPTVINCTFNGNSAGRGGALHNTSGIDNDYYYGIPKLINCLFFDNDATENGGGMYNYYSHPVVTNCTFSDNDTGYGYNGGGVSNDHSSPMLTNCILWDNGQDSGDEIANANNSGPVVRYSCVEGGYTGTGSHDNIDSDPLFGDDYSLSSSSPCIDAGDSNAITLGVDFAGSLRKINNPYIGDTGQDAPDDPCAVVDMGAYEYVWFESGPKISGGERHTLYKRVDRTVWACGSNYNKQLGIGYDLQNPKTVLVLVWGGDTFTKSGLLESCVRTDGGWRHSLAIDKDGFVWAWGKNVCGQIGNTDIEIGTFTTVPVGVENGDMLTGSGFLENIVQVAAGRTGEYSLGLQGNGNVWAWGRNCDGELGNGQSLLDYDPDPAQETTPVQVKKGEQSSSSTIYLEDIVDIDAGINHSIGVDNTLAKGGYVWAWGKNNYGQLGNGQSLLDYDPDPAQETTPVQVVCGAQGGDHLENIVDVDVACGGSSYALEHLDEDGYVWAWGSDEYGQLGNGDTETEPNDEPVWVLKGQMQCEGDHLRNIVAISAGSEHVLALDEDGYVYAWGYNFHGQLGDGTHTDRSIPVQVIKTDETALANIVYIDAGFHHSLAIDEDGNVWAWGGNQYAQLGLGYIAPGYETRAVKMLD